MSSFKRSMSKSVSDTNSTNSTAKTEDHNMASTKMDTHLKKWNVPKVSKKTVYRKGVLNFRKDKSIKTVERIIPLTNKNQNFRLFSEEALSDYREDYNYVHIGLVQVGFKPLTHEGVDTSILVCLRDRRLLDFNDSLLSLLQSSLVDGPVYFNCFPNITVYLRDPNALNSLTLNVQLQSIETRDTCFPVALMCRFHYKCLQDPFNTGARKSSPRDKTLFFQTDCRRPNVNIPKVIQWSEIQFPEEWKLPDQSPPEPQERQYTPNGRARSWVK